MPTPARCQLTLGNSRVVEGPAPLKELGSRAQAVHAEDWVMTATQTTLHRPLMDLPAGGEPTGRRAHVSISFQAEPGWVPWAKTRPPGARSASPNPRPGLRVGPQELDQQEQELKEEEFYLDDLLLLRFVRGHFFRIRIRCPAARMKTLALLCAALLLLLPPEAPATSPNQTPISVVVTNSITKSPDRNYSTYVVYRGILVGGLQRLQDSNTGFTFTYTQNPDYGLFLQSVNGLPGSFENRTYWELLVKTTNKKTIRPDVGIGCYIPNANDKIILNYKHY
ncbi:hypothetical protein L3Q82_019148 [Scortum barcoo]|uniref:Uncharacterized protein n=1 Tax=Scortum barcoo TaxID=214431 RepID=A0ACB8VGC7_9TELE|nr:hypothetical protein L3Q82_019148 [Scortum barcoo]